MNRAILIVICDFLVSAMLSMMTGMVPAHTGGTGVGLDEQTTRVLLAEMHENLNKLERMRELLRETVRKSGGATAEQERQLHELAMQIVSLRRDAEILKRGSEKKQLAKMTAEELRRLLEAEKRERMRSEMELKEHRGDLTAREKELRELRRTVSDTSKAVATLTAGNAELNKNYSAVTASNARLAKSNEELTRSNTRLTRDNAETHRLLERSRTELNRTEQALGAERSRREVAEGRVETAEKRERESRDALDRKRRELEVASASIARGNTERERYRRQTIVLSHDLAKSEKELARAKDEIARKDRNIRQQELTIAKQNTELKERERLLRRGVEDLRQARLALEKEIKAAAAAKVRAAEQEKRIKAQERTINLAQTQLRVANEKLRTRVLSHYGDSVVKLDVDIREALMLGREQKTAGTFYLPLVELGGKTWLVGHADQFLGGGTSLSFKDVKYAGLAVTIPGSKQKPLPLAGPVLLSESEPRLAGVATQLKGRKPLRALTVGELRERGVEELYLFKAGSPGVEYAELKERCSLDIAGNGLHIRNSGSRTQLRAEPGDLILTRTGEFVGLVVEVSGARGSKRRGDQVRAFVLPDAKVWEQPKYAISYAKPRKAEFFTDFEATARRIRDDLNPPRGRR